MDEPVADMNEQRHRQRIDDGAGQPIVHLAARGGKARALAGGLFMQHVVGMGADFEAGHFRR